MAETLKKSSDSVLSTRQPPQPAKEGYTPKGISLFRKQIDCEQREHARHDATISLRLRTEDKKASGITIDMSSKGLRVIAGTSLAAGTPLTLQWSFRGIGDLTISGQVIYCLPSENAASGTYVIAIRFAAVRAWEEKILESVITEIKRNSDTQEKFVLDINVAEDAFALEAAEFYKRGPTTSTSKKLTKNSCIHASKITGWGAYLPPREITNKDINALLNVNGSKTKFGDVVGSVTGIQSRRYAGSQICPSDLAIEASRQALKNAGIDARDVDVLISCGVARDVEEPATAYIIQQKLGASNAYCFDLANACNGFISAIDVMDSFIASGRCEIGLVAVGDVLSQYVTWDAQSRKDLHLSSMSYTFGDGGGAAVVQRADKGEVQGIRARWFLSDGSYWRVAVIPLMDTDRRLFKSNAPNIEEAALRHVPGGVREVMDTLNWKLDDIALVIPHQVSSQIIENLFFKELGMPPEKVFWSFPHHGNVGSASMPVALCAAIDQGRAKLGDKILLVGGSGGFGAGVIGLVL